MNVRRLTFLLLLFVGVVSLSAQPLVFREEGSSWQCYTFSLTVADTSHSTDYLGGSLLLIVPEGAFPRLHIETDETELWHGPVHSQRMSHSKTSGAELPWQCDNSVPVSMRVIGTMRGVSIVQVNYSAITLEGGKAVLHRRMEVTVEFVGADKARSERSWSRTASRHYEPLMAMAANGSLYQTSTAKVLEGRGETMALVAPEAWRAELGQWLRWQRQRGIEVRELYFDTLTANADTILGRLSQIYHDTLQPAPLPSMLLLVGSPSLLPQFPARHRPSGLPSYRTDLYYAEFTGDCLPEMLIGRWSVDGIEQLRGVVAKTLAYEKQSTVDTSTLSSALLVAGREEREPAPVVTNGVVNYVARLLDSLGIDTAAFRNPQSELQLGPIKRALSGGNALVGYTSHCTTMGWLYPTVTTFDIDTMQFHGHSALFVNNCCLSNQIGSDCYGEHLLRKADGAAVGVLGAAGETLWEEDYYWAVGGQAASLSPRYVPGNPGAYDILLRHDTSTSPSPLAAARLLASGNMAVSLSGSPYDAYYWEAYNLLGDPSLSPYIGVPGTMTVQLPATLAEGTRCVEVHSEPLATVTVVQSDSLLGLAVCDSTGRAAVHCRRAILSDSVVVTATKHQHIPAVAVVGVRQNGIDATHRGMGNALWPNPAAAGSVVMAESSEPIRNVQIVDSRGVPQHTGWRSTAENKCAIKAPYTKGVYFVVITTAVDQSIMKMVVE